MNLQQIDYILAVDELRHFAAAADKCHVTQPTLSMMIKKLEEELGVIIFDRSSHPVKPTRAGEAVLEQARKVKLAADHLVTSSREMSLGVSGDLRLGIIPTLAPYLLPLFLKPFASKYSTVNLTIREMQTTTLMLAIKSGAVDMGLLATPLGDSDLEEHTVFQEPFVAYVPPGSKKFKDNLRLSSLKTETLWLLEEGHCFRSQVMQACALRQSSTRTGSIHYEAGSIESLIRIVDRGDGLTIIPFLATHSLSPQRRKQLRTLGTPVPVRQISLVCASHYPRRKLLTALKDLIASSLPEIPLNPSKLMRL